jgi:hypothetical protein
MLWRTVGFAMLLSLIVGYSSSRSPLRADPVACTQYTCKEVHLYWKGEVKYARAVYDGSNGVGNDVREDIWTDKSEWSVPGYVGDDWWYHYTYTSCTPLCAKDGDGIWPAPQELTAVAGTKGEKKDADKLFKGTCQLNTGVPTNPQKNYNTNKYTPPGVDEQSK